MSTGRQSQSDPYLPCLNRGSTRPAAIAVQSSADAPEHGACAENPGRELDIKVATVGAPWAATARSELIVSDVEENSILARRDADEGFGHEASLLERDGASPALRAELFRPAAG